MRHLLTSLLSAFAISAFGTTLNVTNYGAVGDAVWFSVGTTSNSVLVTTTNSFDSSRVNEVLEIFGAGPLSSDGSMHQDFIGYVTNVVNGTNLYVDRVCGATSNNFTAILGTNNSSAFQSCLNAAPSNSIINIPAGTFLMLGPSNLATFTMTSDWIDNFAVTILGGGVTIQGAGITNTTLLACGAWRLNNGHVLRGSLFKFTIPVTNNGLWILSDLTLDGGMPIGDTGNGNFPANPNTGDGWDFTSRAFMDFGGFPSLNQRLFRNLNVTRFKGEQFYSQIAWESPLTNPAMVFTNCIFSGGNATALNLSAGHVVDHCTFSNLNEVYEFYEGYARNPSQFKNSLVTNMFGALMAFNGAFSNSINPPFLIQSNTFYMNGANGIQTTPFQNLFIVGNKFYGIGTESVVSLGVSGYQGSTVNSNILVSMNYMTNVAIGLNVGGSGANSIYNVQFSSNTLWIAGYNSFALMGGWGTNIVLSYNVANKPPVSTSAQGQYFEDKISNVYPPRQYQDYIGKTNTISYALGPKADCNNIIYGGATNAVFRLDDSKALKIPPGAQFFVTNSQNQSTLYTSLSMTGKPIIMPNGYSATFYWTNGVWRPSFNPAWTPRLQVIPVK